jgi:hypothetical protein
VAKLSKYVRKKVCYALNRLATELIYLADGLYPEVRG